VPFPFCSRFHTIQDVTYIVNQQASIPTIVFQKSDRPEIDFEIMTLQSLFSRADALDHSPEDPHRLNFYILLYIQRGRGKHHIDFQPYSYQPGSVLLIARDQVHAYEINPDAEGYMILFTESFLTRNMSHSDVSMVYQLYNYHLNDPMLNLEDPISSEFKKMVIDIHDEYTNNESFGKEEILRLQLKLLLLKLERVRRTIEPPYRNTKWFAQFLRFRNEVADHHSLTRNAVDYADKLRISYKHLNTITKYMTGRTAKQFIDQYIILESKRLLAITDLSVKELSYELGFDEPTNFVKFFKKHTRQSPSNFRK